MPKFIALHMKFVSKMIQILLKSFHLRTLIQMTSNQYFTNVKMNQTISDFRI